jgi:homoserine kinase type II
LAVYTDISSASLERLIQQYDAGAFISLKGIESGVENSNFLLTLTSGLYILTLYEKRITVGELPFFLELLQYLSANHIPCPVPIISRSNQLFTEAEGRPAAIVSFLNGKSPITITSAHCAELGKYLARMHKGAEGFTRSRENNLSLANWRALFEEVRPRADTVRSGLAAELATHLQLLESTWPDNLPRGIIHADLFPDNVFFQDNKLSGMIDFYFACNDFLMYDVAICLNAWCFETNGEFNITKASALLFSYHAERPITEAEWAALPVLAQGAAMRFLLTRLQAWLNPVEGALVIPKNPLEYLQKLRFHQGIATPAAYGLIPDAIPERRRLSSPWRGED